MHFKQGFWVSLILVMEEPLLRNTEVNELMKILSVLPGKVSFVSFNSLMGKVLAVAFFCCSIGPPPRLIL